MICERNGQRVCEIEAKIYQQTGSLMVTGQWFLLSPNCFCLKLKWNIERFVYNNIKWLTIFQFNGHPRLGARMKETSGASGIM